MSVSIVSNPELSEWSLWYVYVILLYFIQDPSMKPETWVQQGNNCMFWCIQIWQPSEVEQLFAGLYLARANENKLH